MTKAELNLLKSQHKMAMDLAICFINGNPHHAFKADLERIIEHNKRRIQEIENDCQVQTDEV